LRAHHAATGIAACAGCHTADTTPVGEDGVTAYYVTLGIDPCNDAQLGVFGLDNDGDLLYDGDDPDCFPFPDINLNPAALDFGVVTIGGSSTLTAQIENLGTADLTVNSITPAAGTSGEFTFMAPATPFIIPPGGSQAVTVTYTPVDVGLDTGELDIDSDDPDEPLVELGLTGEGVDQTVVETEVEAPGEVNGRSQGRTPIGIEFVDENAMPVEIREVQCGATDGMMDPRFVDPIRINREDVDENEFVAFFNTQDLELRCEDNMLVCEGTLTDGRQFMGMDELNVIRDVNGDRCPRK
jgi:hypothetical protein